MIFFPYKRMMLFYRQFYQTYMAYKFHLLTFRLRCFIFNFICLNFNIYNIMKIIYSLKQEMRNNVILKFAEVVISSKPN